MYEFGYVDEDCASVCLDCCCTGNLLCSCSVDSGSLAGVSSWEFFCCFLRFLLGRITEVVGPLSYKLFALLPFMFLDANGPTSNT